ncbi:MAG: NAD-dependent epimerase/dehydratase family protein [Bacteroidia bacterium]
MNKEKILILGAGGQIGTELVTELRSKRGPENIIATDIKDKDEEFKNSGPFEILDVLDKDKLFGLIRKYDVGEVYLLAALLSATAEQKIKSAWKLNMEGLFNVLDLAVEKHINKIFWPSSIAVFGPDTPKKFTPQNTIMNPSTVYGISKQAGERWCEYYFSKFGVDVRGLRYPGLISYASDPGGGTTDYAVHIFHEALEKQSYSCFLKENTKLPMMYMPDALRATLDIMEAPFSAIKIRSSYNVAAMSFSPAEIAAEIKKHIPSFQINYAPDQRQQIAESWPESIDDGEAKKDWGWKAEYNLTAMTEDMLTHITYNNNPVKESTK